MLFAFCLSTAWIPLLSRLIQLLHFVLFTIDWLIILIEESGKRLLPSITSVIEETILLKLTL